MVVVAERDWTVPDIVVELEFFRGESLGFGIVGHGDESDARRGAASPRKRARRRMSWRKRQPGQWEGGDYTGIPLSVRDLDVVTKSTYTYDGEAEVAAPQPDETPRHRGGHTRA
jgi:hypothetical protein